MGHGDKWMVIGFVLGAIVGLLVGWMLSTNGGCGGECDSDCLRLWVPTVAFGTFSGFAGHYVATRR